MVTDGWTRRGFFRRTAAMGAAAACWMSLAACGGGDGAGEGGDLPPKDETLTIGIANEQPYGYMDKSGEATGFAPDVARAVLKEMGYTNLKFEVVEFGQLIGGLRAQQFDLVAAGMYLTPERLEQIAFSDPDYCTSESLAVKEGNPEGIENYQSFVDNKDLTIAVAEGTVEVGYVEDAGVADNQIKPFAGIDQMYAALAAGEVDAVTGTASTVETQVKGREGIEAVEPFIEGIEPPPCGGYGFRLQDTEFRDAFNEQLNKFREDGTTTELITKYEGFTEEDVETANGMTVDDFKGE